MSSALQAKSLPTRPLFLLLRSGASDGDEARAGALRLSLLVFLKLLPGWAARKETRCAA